MSEPRQPRTLGEYRELFALLAGEQSKAVTFLDGKIAAQGRDQKVIADDSQMMMLLIALMHEDGGAT